MSEDVNYFIHELDKRMSKLWWLSMLMIITGIPLGFLIEERLTMISGIGLGILFTWFLINNKIEKLQEKL